MSVESEYMKVYEKLTANKERQEEELEFQIRSATPKAKPKPIERKTLVKGENPPKRKKKKKRKKGQLDPYEQILKKKIKAAHEVSGYYEKPKRYTVSGGSFSGK